MMSMTIKCAVFAAGILAVSIASHAADAASTNGPATPLVSLPENTVSYRVVISPTNAAEFAELKAKEATLVARQREIEQKLFKVFRTLNVARAEAVKDDKELIEMAREIARKQAELEKRTAEKYPALGKQVEERDAMTKEHSTIAQELRDVRKRKDIIEGLLPAEGK